MRRILACFLLLLFIPAAVLAQEFINLSTPGYDGLSPYALPDGRILFYGNAAAVGDYQDSRARLLCLNADGTMAWEYVHPAEGRCSFSHPQLLADGSIGVIFTNSPDQQIQELAICDFSQDGKLLAEPISIFIENLSVSDVTETCIECVYMPGNEPVYEYRFLNWQGKPLFSFPSDQVIGGWHEMLPTAAGILLAGKANGYPAPVVLVKMDLEGNIHWSRTLSSPLPDVDADFDGLLPMADGGFTAVLGEQTYDPDSFLLPTKTEVFLVRYDQEGNILWKQSFQQMGLIHVPVMDMIVYDPYIVVAMAPDTPDGNEPFQYWFDAATGEFAGRTSQLIPEGMTNLNSELFILDSGLWLNQDLRKDIPDDRMAALDSRDEWLVKVTDLER